MKQKLIVYLILLSLTFSSVGFSQTSPAVTCNCQTSGSCTTADIVLTSLEVLPTVIFALVSFATVFTTVYYRKKCGSTQEQLLSVRSRAFSVGHIVAAAPPPIYSAALQ